MLPLATIRPWVEHLFPYVGREAKPISAFRWQPEGLLSCTDTRVLEIAANRVACHGSSASCGTDRAAVCFSCAI